MNTHKKGQAQRPGRLTAVKPGKTTVETPASPRPLIQVDEPWVAFEWLQGIAELLNHYQPEDGADFEVLQSVGWLLLEITEAGYERWRQENGVSGSLPVGP